MPKKSRAQIKVMPAQMQKKNKKKEMTRLGLALRTLGGLGGGAIGNFIGQGSAGSSLGTSLAASLSKWLGAGDYRVSANTIVQRSLNGSDSIPAMHNTGQSITVRHKEFLGEIRGSTGFTVQQEFPLNPGLNTTFPWLNDIAKKFQEYRVKGMVFHYVPTSGSAVSTTNPALGSVMLQTTYRASDTAPNSKVEMLNEYWSSEACPCEAFAHPIECDPKENPFSTQYVRGGLIPPTDNILMYDLGKTFVATSGMPATGNVVGDLWVTYEIELRKPVLNSSVAESQEWAKWSGLAPTNSSMFGTTTIVNTGNLPIAITGNVVSFPKGAVGRWLFTYYCTNASDFIGTNFAAAATLANCSPAFIDATQTAAHKGSTLVGADSSGAYMLQGITITDPAVIATATFSVNFGSNAPIAANLVITQM